MKPEMLQRKFFRALGDIGAAYRLFEALPDVYFFIKNTRGQIIAANRSFTRRMGGSAERDIIGKTGFDLGPEELARRYEADDQQVMRTGKALTNRIELNQDRDGSVDWLVTSKIPLYGRNGRVIGLAGVARNMKEADVFFKPYDRLAPVIKLIAREYNTNLDVSRLAALVNMSLSQFERKFRKVFRMSPRQYIMSTRINHACVMMGDAGKSLAEIALDVGFYDHSAFTKQFVVYMGVPPKTYRKRFMSVSD